MSELTQKEFEAVLALNADYRQAMFLRVAKEQQGFYILIDGEGPVILDDTEEDESGTLYSVLPVWSHAELAEAYAKSASIDAKPQLVSVKAWNESWVESFKDQKLLVGFMPVEDKDFAVDDPVAL